MNKFLLFIFLMSAFTSTAYSRPTIILNDDLNSGRPASSAELHGMAKLSGCSGGLVDIGRNQRDKAVIITNGHCVSSSLVSNMAMINVQASKSFSLYTETGTVSVRSTKLMYATLTETDLALYELIETYEELTKKGVRSFSLYPRSATIGRTVRVTSGYWQETLDCTLDRKVHKLLEGFGSDISNPSVATNAFALSSNCMIKGGYSGTPVVDEETDTLIAIAFTGTEGNANQPCAERSPCEEDASGKRTYHKNTSYVARLDQISQCVLEGKLIVTLPTCTFFR
jgi:hypothetical protein